MPKTTSDLLEAARSYLGVKWMHQGRNRMGIDCIGLVVCALADIGISVNDKKGYRRDPDPVEFLGHINKYSQPSIKPEPGALAIFRSVNQPCHVGLFGEQYGQLSLIHSFAGERVVMEEPFANDWPKLLLGVRRINGIEY